MNWINLNIDVIRGEEYIDAEPVSRATWISLMAWCCSQENGGVIKDARSWGDRKWQQLCGVTLSEVETMCLLYGFDGQNLVVNFYPLDQESKVQKNRASGKKGGRPRKIDAPQTLDTQGEKPCGLPDGSDSLKRNSNSKSNSNSKVSTITPTITPAASEGELNLDKAAPAPAKPKKKAFVPPSREEFIAHAVEKLPAHNAEWTPDRVRSCADLQFDTYVDQDWHDGNGKKIKSWRTKSINSMIHKKPWSFGSNQQSFADQRADASNPFSPNYQRSC
jgi:hypothetical protein|tara:strand:+ start:1440 stop:2267 length:828 start_codon:yes stop_codon:yes gene_type:complete